jgi:SAM-dependent methyltransferase
MNGDAELTSYDSIAEVFTEHAEHPDSWNNLYERPYILSRLPMLEGKNILDLGCSTGYYTEHALKNGASVTTIDISQKLIDKMATRIDSSNLILYCADISRTMPFLGSNSFDLIIASLVLDYIKDWSALFEEFYRMLVINGRLIFTVSHPTASYLHIKPDSYYDFKLVEDTWARLTDHPFKTYYYIRPLTEMLKPILQSKFKVEVIEEMLPDESLKESNPELYQRLIERPGFLYIEMVKEAG